MITTSSQSGAATPLLPSKTDPYLLALEQSLRAYIEHAVQDSLAHAMAAAGALDESLREATQVANNSPMPNGRPAAVAELTDGEKFRDLRLRAGLSQARAAKLCDVDPSTVFRWEKGTQLHTHKAKNPQLTRGLDLMRWAAEKRESTGKPVSIDEMTQEAARRARRKVS